MEHEKVQGKKSGYFFLSSLDSVGGGYWISSGGPLPSGKSFPLWSQFPPGAKHLLDGLASGKTTSVCFHFMQGWKGFPLVAHIWMPPDSPRLASQLFDHLGNRLALLNFLRLKDTELLWFLLDGP